MVSERTQTCDFGREGWDIAIMTFFTSSSGKCHNQIVLTPMIEKHSTESLREQLPYTLTLISMPAATDGKRGFSVSVEGGCSSYATGVQVKE